MVLAHPELVDAYGRCLEVWPESHWPGFALLQVDVLQWYTA